MAFPCAETAANFTHTATLPKAITGTSAAESRGSYGEEGTAEKTAAAITASISAISQSLEPFISATKGGAEKGLLAYFRKAANFTAAAAKIF